LESKVKKKGSRKNEDINVKEGGETVTVSNASQEISGHVKVAQTPSRVREGWNGEKECPSLAL